MTLRQNLYETDPGNPDNETFRTTMMTNNDISDIARQTDDYCFHSHTQFCDGRATMAEMAEAALNAGMKHYGFTPPLPYHGGVELQHEPRLRRLLSGGVRPA